MPDTVRTVATLQAMLSDGAAAHSTNRQLIRDLLVSLDSIASAYATVAVEAVQKYPILGSETGVTDKTFPYGDVRRFGASPSNTAAQNATSINNAILSIKSDSSTLGGAPAPSYVGNTLFFAKGRYLVSPDSLDIDDIINIRFVGEGSRLWNNYFPSTTAIIIDGTGTTSASWGIRVSGQVVNMTRHVAFENIAIMYTNGFLGDLIEGDCAGFEATSCWFGSDSVSSTRPLTCANLIRLWTGHHYRFTNCNFSDADVGVRIDNTTGANTNGWTFTGCSWFDFTTANIYCDGTAVAGLAILGGESDPVSAAGNPVYGFYLNSTGFTITGHLFAGSTFAKAATTSWVYVAGGEGVITGNTFNTNVGYCLWCNAGTTEFSNNRVNAITAVKCDGSGGLRGGGNRYIYCGTANTEKAVELVQTAACIVDIGPDIFSVSTSDGTKKHATPYSVPGGLTQHGVIRYNTDLDATAGGPVYTNKRGGIRLEPTNNQKVTTGTATLSLRDAGKVFHPAATATYTIPANIPGQIEYTFVKATTNSITIARTGTNDLFYDGSGAAKTGLSNVTAEVGSVLTIRSECDGAVTIWMVTTKTGTWT